MSVFEYKCAACGEVSEFLVGVAREAESIRCGSCGSTRMKKVFSPISFTVKQQAAPSCSCCSAHDHRDAHSASACEAMGCPKAV